MILRNNLFDLEDLHSSRMQVAKLKALSGN